MNRPGLVEHYLMLVASEVRRLTRQVVGLFEKPRGSEPQLSDFKLEFYTPKPAKPKTEEEKRQEWLEQVEASRSVWDAWLGTGGK